MRSWTAVTESPAQSSGARRRTPPSPLTSDHHEPFGVPASEAECDALLALSEARTKLLPMAVRQELVADLARFLGAGSQVWIPKRRARLQKLLVEAGQLSLGPILAVVARTPRDEVMDDAVAVLASSADVNESVAFGLVELLGLAIPEAGPTSAPAVREVLVRALTRSSHPFAIYARVNVAFRLAQSDPSPVVRDAAVQALSMMCEREGSSIVTALLSKLKDGETSAQVRDSIDGAIETLRGC